MAEKHKSKYKAPKDLEKSQKPKARKDLKDYTEDDKKGGLNPKSTGDKQLNVLRKTDKEVVDTGDLFVKYNADDRLYKDLEDGEYDPKHAAKVLKKRQDKDEKDNEKNIKDKIENLTREQRERLKERLIKEYIRRKVERILTEAEAEAEEAPTPEAPTPEAPAGETTAPEAPIDPAATEPAAPVDATTETPPAPETPSPDASSKQTDSQSVTARIDYNAAGSQIAGEKNTIFRVEAMGNIINGALNTLKEPKQKESFLRMLRSQVIKKYKQMDHESKSEE
jgi:hypothetical protein